MASIRDEILSAIEKKQNTSIGAGQNILLKIAKSVTALLFMTLFLIGFILKFLWEIFLDADNNPPPSPSYTENELKNTKHEQDAIFNAAMEAHHHHGVNEFGTVQDGDSRF